MNLTCAGIENITVDAAADGSVSLLPQIERYWSRRSESYSDLVRFEMSHENERMWMDVITEKIPADRYPRVLDIGTGPGFFAICLAKRGFDVTAVDYTPAMLERAKANAGCWNEFITFRRMDAQALEFADGTFDAIVTRNLTWNLEDPARAYREWRRVLKKGGKLLNFDAGWYSYLYDEEKSAEYARDREAVKASKIYDYNSYPEGHKMEAIAQDLLLSRLQRPEADIGMLYAAGFGLVEADLQIGEKVWDETEKVNYRSTPMFLLEAEA